MSAAAMENPPKWVMLERFVSRRDDDKSFPDESKAPIRTSGTTSWNAPFSVAFKLEKPPGISRLYAHLPGFGGDPRSQLLSILSTHQQFALFRVGNMPTDDELFVQDLFIFSSFQPSSMKLLPHCTLPDLGVHARCDARQSRHTSTRPPPEQRVMCVTSLGLLCQGKEFVVAEAQLLVRGRNYSQVYVDIYWLRSPDCKWESVRTRVLSRGSTKDFSWGTYTVIPVRNWLCWIDYYNGILLGDFHEPTPTVTLVRLPLEEFPTTDLDIIGSCWMYRSMSAIEAESCLKFVKVDRGDCISYGPLRKDAGFTITCHTLSLDDEMMWEMDYRVTSEELWSANTDLPREILLFPQVNIDKPHIVHFLMISESKFIMKKMWVVTIDMKTKKMESCYEYIKGKEDLETEDADLAKGKSDCPLPFLPCEFSKFLHLSRKRRISGLTIA